MKFVDESPLLKTIFVCLFILVLTIHAVSEISEYCHLIVDPRKIEEIKPNQPEGKDGITRQKL